MIGVSVSLVVTGGDVQDNVILDSGFLVHIIEGDPDCGEHPPSSPGDDHLCSKLTELVPEIFVIKIAIDSAQFFTIAFFTNFAFLFFLDNNFVKSSQVVTGVIRVLAVILGVWLCTLNGLRLGLDAGHDGCDGEV